MNETVFICPNCGMKMNKKEYCFHCGYMSNGNTIDPKKINAALLELYLDTDYNKIIRNNNWPIAGLFGPIYILSRGFYIPGLILTIIDMAISIAFMLFNHAYLFYYMVVFLNFLYMLFNRLVWGSIGNIIYLKLLEGRLKRFKKMHPHNYKLKLQNRYRLQKKSFLLQYIIFGVICIIIFFMIRAKIYNYLGLI